MEVSKMMTDTGNKLLVNEQAFLRKIVISLSIQSNHALFQPEVTCICRCLPASARGSVASRRRLIKQTMRI